MDAGEIIESLEGNAALPAPSDAIIVFANTTARSDPNARQLGPLLGKDKSVTDKLIRIANSASMSRGTPIDTVEGALVRIGILQAIPLAIGLSLIGNSLSARRRKGGFEKTFWQRSLGTASLMQAFAPSGGGRSGPDTTYFSCGLFAHVGELALARHFGEDYVTAWHDTLGMEPAAVIAAERDAFGITSQDIADILLWRWRVTPPVVRAVNALAEEKRESGSGAAFLNTLVGAYRLSGALVSSTAGLERRETLRGELAKASPADAQERFARSLELWSRWHREFELPRLNVRAAQTLKIGSRQSQPGMPPFPEAWLVAGRATRERLCPLLEALGWPVWETDRKQQYLDRLESKELPALLIADEEIKGLSGADACRLRRAVPETMPGYNVIVGAGEREDIPADWYALCDDVIEPGASRARLLGRIRVATRTAYLLQHMAYYAKEDPIDPATGIVEPGRLRNLFEEHLKQARARHEECAVLLVRIFSRNRETVPQDLVEMAMLLGRNIRRPDSRRIGDLLVKGRDDALLVLSRNSVDNLRRFAERVQEICDDNPLIRQHYDFAIAGSVLLPENCRDPDAYLDNLHGMAGEPGTPPAIKHTVRS